MQIAITFVAVVAGMALSLGVALLAEELIFGQLIRLFFVTEEKVSPPSPRGTTPARTRQKR